MNSVRGRHSADQQPGAEHCTGDEGRDFCGESLIRRRHDAFLMARVPRLAEGEYAESQSSGQGCKSSTLTQLSDAMLRCRSLR